MFENSVTFMAVANVANALTDGSSVVTDLPAGSAGIFREIGDAFEKSASIRADASHFYVGWKDASGQLHKSPRFQGTKISEAVSKAGTALVDQISFVGFNGTSGSITVANSTYYSLSLVLNHTFGMFNNSPLMKTIPFKSGAAATQSAIANGLASAGSKSFARGVNKDVIFEVLDSGTSSAIGGTESLTVINGSKVVTSTGSSHALVAGDTVRIGHATNNDYPVYLVASVSGAAITLTNAYQGASASGVAAGEVTLADAGIRLTGNSISDTEYKVVASTPYVVNFDVDVSESLQADLRTTATPSDIGNGTYQLVSFQESRVQFEDRPRTIELYPPTIRRIEAVPTKLYEIATFVIVDDAYQAATTGFKPVSPANLSIATETSLTTDIADYVTVLAAENLA